MSKIKKAFENGKAFIAFLTCGDPDLETTAAAVRAAAANGADLIELGIPFSDPTAEGPVIQNANLRALRGGITTDRIFGFVKELRRDVSIPMVFMTYANVIFSYGAERFLAACQEVGVDGLILPDLPYEEKEEFLPFCRRHGVDLISLIAPNRIRDFHPRTGKKNGGYCRWRHCLLGNRQTARKVRPQRPSIRGSVCKIYEGCHEIALPFQKFVRSVSAAAS